MKQTSLRAFQSACRWALALVLGLSPSVASALPGFFAGKDGAERTSRSTQVVVMTRGDQTVVSVMSDYQGPNEPFAFVMPVPKDVTLDGVKTLKRASVERLDELSAPRFHEFWEKDPCEPGKPEQIWEQSLVARSESDFLGTGDMFKGATKAPPEMREKVDPDFRLDGSEFTFALVGSDVLGWLKGKGYQVPSGISLDAYAGMSFLVAIVDPEKVELGKTGEALLSPIRYTTRQSVKIASTLGLSHVKGKQELIIYTLDPTKRFEVANYKTAVPPSNLQVDFKVKERTGEYYAAMHDLLLAKDKQAFLAEYAWDTKTCGEPCPNAKMAMHELLTLGADAFEAALPEEERNPKPPERTPEEEEIYKKAKKDERKQMDELAAEVARRKAMIARQDNYVLSRLHHRYDKEGLPKDVELKAASAIEGGVGVPQGEHGDLPQGSKPSQKNTLQTRLVSLHPDISVIKCPNPERHRWGKPPLSYRGARKVWVADQLATRNRTQQNLKEATLTAVPDLGIPGVVAAKAEKAAAEQAAEAEKASSGCRMGGRVAASGGEQPSTWAMTSLLVAGLLVRRRRLGRG